MTIISLDSLPMISESAFSPRHSTGDASSASVSAHSSDERSTADPDSPIDRKQATALPYRFDTGIQKVLLVRARTRGHWTLPKANISGSLTEQQVAVDEAFEEAGVRGATAFNPIGMYRYSLNQIWRSISVVPVLVEEELDEWPESERERCWFTLEEASNNIPSDGLRKIVVECGNRQL